MAIDDLSNLVELEQIDVPILTKLLQLMEKSKEVDSVQMGEIMGREGRVANDNFNSSMHQFQVKYTCSGAEKELHVIVKVPPTTSLAPLMSKVAKAFARERLWYSVMQQELAKVCPDIGSISPRALHAASNFKERSEGFCKASCPLLCWCLCQESERGLVLLENLTKRENPCYMMDRKKVPELSYILLAVRALAKFHGAWLLYRHKLNRGEIDSPPYTFQELNFQLKSYLPMAAFKGLISGSLKLIEELLIKAGDTASASWLNNYRKTKALSRPAMFLPGSPDNTSAISTVAHGDFWGNNMMFDKGPDGQPHSVVILDYQVMGLGNPACDIVYFLYVNTNRAFRDTHLAAILAAYYEVLEPFLEQAGISFSLDEFKQEYQDRKDLGLVLASGTMSNSLNPEEVEYLGLKAMRDYNKNRRNLFLNERPEEDPIIEVIRSRLMEMAQELAEENFLGVAPSKSL